MVSSVPPNYLPSLQMLDLAGIRSWGKGTRPYGCGDSPLIYVLPE
jgi:hypothetical protein